MCEPLVRSALLQEVWEQNQANAGVPPTFCYGLFVAKEVRSLRAAQNFHRGVERGSGR